MFNNLPPGVSDIDIPGNRPCDRNEEDEPVFYARQNGGRRLTKEVIENGVDYE